MTKKSSHPENIEEELVRHRRKVAESKGARTRERSPHSLMEKGIGMEEMFKAVYDQAKHLAGLVDVNGILRYANRTACDLIGFDPSQVINKPFVETPWWRHSEEARQQLRSGIERAIRGECVQYETTICISDGSLHYIDMSLLPVRDESGQILYIIPEARDITARKQAEEALREKTEQLDYYFMNALDLLSVADTDGYFRRLNKEWELVLGYTMEELMNRPFLEFVHPDDREATIQSVVQLENNRPVSNFVNRYRRKDGSYVWIEWRSVSRGKIIYTVARDISKRKRAEEALQYRRELEHIITGISTRFVNLGQDDIDDAITQALGVIGPFTGADRCYLFFFREDASLADNTHEWCGAGVESCKARLQGLRVGDFPVISEPLKRSEVVSIPRVADLPNESESFKTELEFEGIQSLVLTPIEFEKEVVGFLGLDAVRQEKSWPPDITSLLRIAGEVFAAALERKKVELSLRRTNETLRVTLEAAPVAIFNLDMEGCVKSLWNKAAEKIFGWRREEVLGKILPTVPENSMEEFKRHIAILNSGKPIMGREALRRRKDGSPIYYYIYAAPEFDANGKVIGSMAILLDITELKHAEEALRASEERFRTLFDQAADAFFVHDQKGRFVDVNRVACERLGYSREELLGMSVSEVEIHIKDTDLIPLWKRVLKGRGETVEGVHRRRDGSTIPVEVHINVIQYGERPLMFAAARDLTHRKKIEEDLLLKDRALHSSVNAVIINSMDGKTIYVNESLLNLFGYTREEAMALDARDLAYYADGNQRVFSALETQGYYLGEEMAKHKDGSPFPISTSASLILDANGKPIATMGSFIDISERKRAEEEKAKLQDQLQQAMKMEAVGRLAGGIAHDFNNLLTAITGHVELAKMDPNLSESVVQDLNEVSRAANSVASLTRQLLAFSRKQIIEPKVLNLNDLIENLKKMLIRLIGEDITLQTSLEEGLGAVKVDPGQFEQIVLNLVVNARDAMPHGGKLRIETLNITLDEDYCAHHPYVHSGNYILLSVNDTGCGMSPEVKQRLFEPFFTTKPKGRGTGLGLATIFGAVKQAGGSIEVYSEVGIGTTIKIYLPRVEEPATRLVKEEAPQKMPGGHETILLVEDEKSVREMTLMILSRLGYTMLNASNGSDALGLVDQYPGRIDLLMTDVVMPGMNGRELSEQIIVLQPKIKVLFTSGYAENVIVDHGVVKENLNFIGKPYSLRALAQKIRAVLSSGEQ